MPPTPSISIIIPAHNAERYLGPALDSVRAQTRADWAAIVVDDGSTDGTQGVAGRYLIDERFQLIQQAQAGPSAARNAGLAQASGEYVAFLDADDVWRPAYLERMTAALEARPEAAAAGCGWQYLDMDGRPLPQQVVISAAETRRLGETLQWQNPLIPSGLVARRSAAQACGEFDTDLRGVEDWDYAWRLAQMGPLAGVAEALVLYRTHPAGLSADVGRMEDERVKLLHKIFGPIDGRPETWPPAARRCLAQTRYETALELLSAGPSPAGVQKLREALRLWPGLATDPATFFELACAHQPRGYRGTPQRLDLAQAERLLGAVTEAGDVIAEADRRTARGWSGLALAQLARQAGRRGLSARYAFSGLRLGAQDQRRAALAALARSFAPPRPATRVTVA